MTTRASHLPFLLALALLAIPASAAAGDWSWNLTPYFWLPDITVDVQISDREVFDRQVEFSDLIDAADGAFMAHLEGRREAASFGIFADLFFVDLGDDARMFDIGAIPITAEADLELTIIDVGGVWYVSGDSGFGVHYGVRLIDVDSEVDVRGLGGLPANRRLFEIARTELDGLIGGRYFSEISPSGWSFAGWIDFSAGGSDGSWGGTLVAGYHFGSNDRYGISFGYRHLQIELGDEDRQAKVESDISLSGPVVGFTFAW